MNSRTAAVVAVAALALLAVGFVRIGARSERRASDRAGVGDPGDRSRPLDEVERIVAERNQKEKRSEQDFRAAGWTLVDADPPDPRVTGFDPTLLAAGREPELRVQLASTSASPKDAHRIAQILVQAREPATREAAALALGRIRTPEGRAELIEVLTSGKLDPEDLGRRQLAALIRPVDLDDEIAARMAGLLDSDKITRIEKKQIAFTLALTGLRDGMSLPPAVLDSMSADARALVTQASELGQRQFAIRGDVHP
jgi:hypothetical protein